MKKRLSECTEQETMEFLFESLREAADIARQLRKLQEKEKWGTFAQILDKINYKSQQLATAKALSRAETIVLLDQERKKLVH